MITNHQKLHEIINIGLEIAGISDLDLVLEKILKKARHLVNADAGSIYIRDNDDRNKLNFCYTQNDTLANRGFNDNRCLNMPGIVIDHKSIAGYVAATGEILNIPDVYSLVDGSPYSFNRDIDMRTGYHTRSMLVYPLKSSPLLQTRTGDEIVGVLQLINARDQDGRVIAFPSSENDIQLIQLFACRAGNAIHHARMLRTMVLNIVRVAELRDPSETGAHVKRVGAFSAEIYETWARNKAINQAEIEKFKDAIRITAMLHDVGKVAIEDAILKKPGRLTENEYERMKEHTVMGARLLQQNFYSDYDLMAAEIALNHHEHWDGTGYPGYINILSGDQQKNTNKNRKRSGKKGEDIPLAGRIVAVADVYDALSHQRIYKEEWEEQRVLQEIRSGSGSSFDPEIVEAFFQCYEKIKSISQGFHD